MIKLRTFSIIISDRYDLEAKENNEDQEDNKAIAMSGHGLLSAISKQTQSVWPLPPEYHSFLIFQNQHQQIVAKLAQLHASQLQQFAQKAASGNSAGIPPQIKNKSVQVRILKITEEVKVRNFILARLVNESPFSLLEFYQLVLCIYII